MNKINIFGLNECKTIRKILFIVQNSSNNKKHKKLDIFKYSFLNMQHDFYKIISNLI